MQTPRIILVGLGVVGRAILDAHLESGHCVTIVDLDPNAIDHTLHHIKLDPNSWSIKKNNFGDFPSCDLVSHDKRVGKLAPRILVESIAERLDIKREFFKSVQSLLNYDDILCSNTSTLRIRDIAESLPASSRFLGMHFFMPVKERDAVEIIPTSDTHASVIQLVTEHVKSLNKFPIVVADSPGFVVNRMLSPYLNEAMVLLAQGARPEQIEDAALQFGMPLSPLELIDWIGARTMFDAGRVYWQSFPNRIDPSPIMPAMIKAGRQGRASGRGFYNYETQVRSREMAPEAVQICERYQRKVRRFTDREVLMRLTIPMWIEAALLLKDRVTTDRGQIEIAMAGGLGYKKRGAWFDFFDSLGSKTLLGFMREAGPNSKSLVASLDLQNHLSATIPSKAMDNFTNQVR